MNKVVKYYADWCSSCKAIVAGLNQLEEWGKVEVEEVNVDHDRLAARAANVRRLPTLVVINDSGNEVGRAYNLTELQHILNEV